MRSTVCRVVKKFTERNTQIYIVLRSILLLAVANVWRHGQSVVEFVQLTLRLPQLPPPTVVMGKALHVAIVGDAFAL